jgi:hypothetical protein
LDVIEKVKVSSGDVFCADIDVRGGTLGGFVELGEKYLLVEDKGVEGCEESACQRFCSMQIERY